MNIYASSSQELVAILFSGVLERQIGFKSSLLFGYLLAGIFGALVSVSEGNSDTLYALFLMLSRFGYCITVNVNTIATLHLFPSSVLASVFGFKNTFARFTTVMAPLAAEFPSPYPMAIFSSASLFCCILTGVIDTRKKYTN